VIEAAETARETGADLIVTVGGGSIIAGNRRGRVASVIGIDHDYHGFANSLPDRPAKPKVLAGRSRA